VVDGDAAPAGDEADDVVAGQPRAVDAGFKATGIEDERAMGFALGVASHAIGTARAFQISDVAGAFASLGMILNALLTIALVPVALSLLVA
jgi:putative effector of murein hydrolase